MEAPPGTGESGANAELETAAEERSPPSADSDGGAGAGAEAAGAEPEATAGAPGYDARPPGSALAGPAVDPFGDIGDPPRPVEVFVNPDPGGTLERGAARQAGAWRWAVSRVGAVGASALVATAVAAATAGVAAAALAAVRLVRRHSPRGRAVRADVVAEFSPLWKETLAALRARGGWGEALAGGPLSEVRVRRAARPSEAGGPGRGPSPRPRGPSPCLAGAALGDEAGRGRRGDRGASYGEVGAALGQCSVLHPDTCGQNRITPLTCGPAMRPGALEGL